MSVVKIKCAACGVKLEIPRSVVGKNTQCSACEFIFRAEKPISPLVVFLLLSWIAAVLGFIYYFGYHGNRLEPQAGSLPVSASSKHPDGAPDAGYGSTSGALPMSGAAAAMPAIPPEDLIQAPSFSRPSTPGVKVVVIER